MKRTVLFFFIIILLLQLSGCSALFFDTYYSEKDFQGNQSIDLDSDVQMVHNYAELRRLVFNMMNNHEESTSVRFAGYSGNAVSDIASVCNAVKTENAYGAYCVDYISYDLTQIVSYYEASISISYIYTAEELSLLKNTNNHDSYSELLAQELGEGSTKIVTRVNNGVSDHSSVVNLIEQTIREYPLSMTYYPEFTVKIFSGNSSQKIYEVNIVYNEELNNEKRLSELSDRVTQLTASFGNQEEAVKAMNAAEALESLCKFDSYAGNTAYDALVVETADSEGIASAFKALCDQLEIECQIVNGRLEREEHFWNIVKIQDAYYHFDISLLKEKGAARSLFQNDADRQVNYWWDQSAYPDCVGDLVYWTVKSR